VRMMREVIDDFLAIAVGDEGALGARVASVGGEAVPLADLPS